MANARLPTHKREAAAAAGNGHRYDNLPDTPTSDALGDPSAHLDPMQLASWHWAVRTWWWLTEADRPLLEIICKLRAKDELGELFIGERAQYMTALKLVGGTPVDRSKVELPKTPDESEHDRIAQRFT